MIPESWGGEPGRRTRQEVSGQQDQNKNQFSLLVSACCSGLMLLLSLLVTVCLHFLGSGTFFFFCLFVSVYIGTYGKSNSNGNNNNNSKWMKGLINDSRSE